MFLTAWVEAMKRVQKEMESNLQLLCLRTSYLNIRPNLLGHKTSNETCQCPFLKFEQHTFRCYIRLCPDQSSYNRRLILFFFLKGGRGVLVSGTSLTNGLTQIDHDTKKVGAEKNG